MKTEPKLFIQVRALNVKDFGRVKKLLKSPFFTQNKNLPPLFNYLIQFYPALKSEKLNKQAVFQKVFRNKPFSDSKYTNLCFECAKLIEQYLIIKKREEDEFYRNSELHDIYFEKLGGEYYSNNFSLYKNTENKLSRLVNDLPEIAASEADEELKKFHFYEKTLKKVDFKKLTERVATYDNMLSALENFYAVKKEILTVERLNLINYLGIKESPEKEKAYFQNIYFKLFALLKDVIANEDLKAYSRAKNLAFENILIFPENIREDIFQLLKNFLIRGQRKNTRLYTTELIELYSEIIKNEYLVSGGLFKTVDFINTVITLSPIDLKKAQEFHSNYKKHLPDKEAKDAEQLSNAHILYHQKKLKESFAKVSAHKFTRHMTEMMARAHELRCGYEIFSVDPDFREFYREKLINIGKQFKRSKFPPAKRIALENLVVILKRLVKSKMNNDLTNETREKLLFEVENMRHLTSRKWLKEKIKSNE